MNMNMLIPGRAFKTNIKELSDESKQVLANLVLKIFCQFSEIQGYPDSPAEAIRKLVSLGVGYIIEDTAHTNLLDSFIHQISEYGSPSVCAISF